MSMTIQEARAVGASKLRIPPELFRRALSAAKGMEGMRVEDLGPMALALALMGISEAHKSSDQLENELTDALQVVAKAENEWRMEMAAEAEQRRSRLI